MPQKKGRPRGGPRIENSRYWDLPDKSLLFIIKDAGEAMMKNPMSRTAGKWADQLNDASSVLGWRRRHPVEENNINDNLKEASVAARDGVVPDIAHAGTSFGLGAHRIDSDEVMSKINAIIGKYVDEEFVDPVAPVRVIRQHLSQLGVGFHFQQVAELAYDNEGEIGGVTIPLFQWGGRYGRLKDDSAEMFQDDGVSHLLKPLSIRFDWIQHENNSYSLAAKIIPS